MEGEVVKKESYNYDDNLELIQLARGGNKEALNKVIEMNLPLVSSVSKKF